MEVRLAMTYRILVTGSRDWPDAPLVWDVLDSYRLGYAEFGDTMTLVHGACPTGADRWADRWAHDRGVAVERYPADWSQGKSAGPQRNAQMVATVPDVCLAFIKGGSRGASHCADLAEKSGILTQRWERP